MAHFPLKKLANHLALAGGVFLHSFIPNSTSLAQIESDNTLSTHVITINNQQFTITGGTQAGGNLFHSLREFSVPAGGEAFFDNSLDVQNIITRVTGSSISNIEGIIRANGTANLFLLNPNGILLGPNAQLAIGGSFVATTAHQMQFADGSVFSASDPQSPPLLTLSVPIGLQFGNSRGEIINQSRAESLRDSQPGQFGLEVDIGKTIALVGGNISLVGGGVNAPGGRVELGSVGSNDYVSLSPIPQGWALGYEGVQNFSDIQLQEALINTTGQNSGNIVLTGRQLAITDNSLIVSFNDGVNPGGSIVIKASDSVELTFGSNIFTTTFSSGASGEIIIETKQLFVRNFSFINASNLGNGLGGNITINASEFMEAEGGIGGLSGLTTQTVSGTTNSGDIKITTGRLTLRNGGVIDSSNNGSGGDGGTIIIDASDSVEVIGRGITPTQVQPSRLQARTRGEGTTGNGGSIIINTGRLFVGDGGIISVAADQGSLGQAGSLQINASDSIVVDGTGSALSGISESSKPAGNLTINTPQLTVINGGQINVSSTGMGAAGNLFINTENLLLNNQGRIQAETNNEQGNISLSVTNNLFLRNNSSISTTARGIGDGGNIDINARYIFAVPIENSDITANAFEGRGGNITITTQGIFGIEPRGRITPLSDINASSELGINGVVQINRPDFEPQDQLSDDSRQSDTPQINDVCEVRRGELESRFVITGRGGYRPDPTDILSSSNIWEDIEPPQSLNESKVEPHRDSSSDIVEAQSWFINDQGKVMLVSQSPKVFTKACVDSSENKY
ncbi:filamentous hemagglutinin family outer membrane protein [Gloeothece citriformis PCC 7424]|uniref:Filamentous hemagglutinin family outer membrane protein n=1 Tax=Gloeothece citriformis (strain PCC 7424) TaxID=65393 RepID=B7KH81_GLOC7|nr:filamentous hemagglutinin N-terminal domain-containing protein [Gloeothece citriformis]ACK69290.1 filamentous hemagglutinin family outer membrane protein [Gloeothece citriformis PCC 7424]